MINIVVLVNSFIGDFEIYLQMVSEVDIGDREVSIWPMHFEFCWE